MYNIPRGYSNTHHQSIPLYHISIATNLYNYSIPIYNHINNISIFINNTKTAHHVPPNSITHRPSFLFRHKPGTVGLSLDPSVLTVMPWQLTVVSERGSATQPSTQKKPPVQINA